MKSKSNNILEFINKNPGIPRVELQVVFGDIVKRTLGHLQSKKLIITETVNKIPCVFITLEGKEVVQPGFCSSCECDPCDCHWGN